MDPTLSDKVFNDPQVPKSLNPIGKQFLEMMKNIENPKEAKRTTKRF